MEAALQFYEHGKSKKVTWKIKGKVERGRVLSSAGLKAGRKCDIESHSFGRLRRSSFSLMGKINQRQFD